MSAVTAASSSLRWSAAEELSYLGDIFQQLGTKRGSTEQSTWVKHLGMVSPLLVASTTSLEPSMMFHFRGVGVVSFETGRGSKGCTFEPDSTAKVLILGVVFFVVERSKRLFVRPPISISYNQVTD